MIRIFYSVLLITLLSSCWPSRISFVDGTMPDEWKTFYVKTLDNNAPNTPLSYAASLSENVKDGVQNNTRLLLNNDAAKAEIEIEGVITNYAITPVALQEGDNAAQNRLTVAVNFNIFVHQPEEDNMTLVSSRFIDYDSNTDLGIVETQLLEEVNVQIVQDVVNKLISNW